MNDQEKIEKELFGNKCPFSPCCSVGCYQALDEESASHPCRFDRLIQNEDAIKAITLAKSQSQAEIKELKEDVEFWKNRCEDKNIEIGKLEKELEHYKKEYRKLGSLILGRKFLEVFEKLFENPYGNRKCEVCKALKFPEIHKARYCYKLHGVSVFFCRRCATAFHYEIERLWKMKMKKKMM